MRGVSGLHKPGVQWTFVAIAFALLVVIMLSGVALTRMRAAMDAARADAMQARVDREQIEAAFQRERSARESLALQLGRERTGAAAGAAGPPTLTLSPVRAKSPKGPELAVPQTSAPLIVLRLLLPAKAPADASYEVRLRSWTTGDLLWLRGGLRAGTADGKAAVIAPIASDVFAPGAYEVVLNTTASPPSQVADYEVSVIEQRGR
ncbi:MAG: hypothetical protein DMF85_06675 [Acidobacteria bacterium]|nr:MAG: hypothetical protein DMF85_06675 [Acidobacteriota bacterium]